MLQIRPADYDPSEIMSGRQKEVAYAPARDLAYLLRAIAENVPGLLEPANVPDWIGRYLEDKRVTQAQLQAGAAALLLSLDYFRDPEFQTANKALEAGGFWALPNDVKVAVMTALGLIVTGWYFGAIRSALPSPNLNLPKVVLATPQMVDAFTIGKEQLKREPFYKRWLRKGGKL